MPALAQSLQDLTAQVAKIATEESGLVARIAALEAQVSALLKVVVPFSWTTFSVQFGQGTAGSVNLNSYLTNPEGRSITYAAIGTLPTGVTLSGPTLTYNGSGGAGSANVAFTATSGSWSVTSGSVTILITTLAADTTAPSVPTGLSATAVSSSQIDLSWSASTDPVVGGQLTSGVSSYRIYRDGTQAQIVPAPTVTWSDTGRSPSTPYSYRVAAVDGAGNASAQSTAVTATTLASGGTGSATINWNPVTTNSAGLTFDNSTPDRTLAGYRVYYGTVRSAVVSGSAPYVSASNSPYIFSSLAAGTWYFRVVAVDGDGDESTNTDVVSKVIT
jgi:hypothetical protein